MPPAVPRATYRLQLTADFGFDRAAAIVPYLKSLGISHLYTSPFMKARAGSTHGYDITDHNTLNPEFGGEEGFARLSDALKREDMGLIVEFVPNHMGVGRSDNGWWLDVLEWGPRSPFAAMFDIDWSTLPYRHQGGLLLPVLGKPYGEALEQGDIKLKYQPDEGSFSFWYFEHRLPVRPDRYSEILRAVVEFAQASAQDTGKELLRIAAQQADLRSPSRAAAPAFKQSIAAVDGGRAIIEAGLAAYRPAEDDPMRIVALHRLLERQHYRVAHWRVAISEINYRRFFDINDLAGIRVEDMRTFRLIHHKVADLIFKNQLQGIRLDHIDGLYDPAQYCQRLHRLVGQAQGRKPFYTIIEKILAPGEKLRKFAGVAGTTGYDVLNLISRVLASNDGLPILEQAWQTSAAPSRNYQQIVEDAKIRVLEATMASEFTVLVRLLSRIAAGHWPSRDFTQDRLRAALESYVVHFPIYRTYIAGDSVSDQDREIIRETIAAARERWYGSDATIFDFLQDVLTLDLVAPGKGGYSAPRVKRFAAKMQQLTGPVTAKAVEDTAFYRYHRLLAFNEVGNDPSLPALSVAEFHQSMVERAKMLPQAMTATATHDTKRGEDARMRILALTEIAEDWSQAARRWSAQNARLTSQTKHRIPSRAHEYMLYQALIGVWEGDGTDAGFVDRIVAYAIKAAREGKQETSWTNPDENYEQGLTEFVRRLLDPKESRTFLDEFRQFVQRAALLGRLNTLSQLVLKATIPGIPDFYQGTEFWDFSLVDPDNRRPVDFDMRKARLRAADDRQIIRSGMDEDLKLHLTRRLIAVRSRWPSVFERGNYAPLAVEGKHCEHLIAFARVTGSDAIVVAAGRHFAPLTDGGNRWPEGAEIDATLKLNGFRIVGDTLIDRSLSASGALPLGELLATVPVAVLQAKTA
jgi:(1->4)-alpha-D-glucan 1-alpha-D-glucosylmutase